MRLTIEEFEAHQQKGVELHSKLEQKPDSVMLKPGTITFYRADKEIGFVNINTGAGALVNKVVFGAAQMAPSKRD